MPTLVWCISDIVVIDYLTPIIGKAPIYHNLLVLAVTIKCPPVVNLVCILPVWVYMVLALESVITRLGFTGPYECADAFRI